MQSHSFRTRLALSLPLLAMIAACADSGANYTPITDGAPSAAFRQDLGECQQLARANYRDAAGGTAAVGAGIGAVAGLADDDTSDTEGLVGGLIVGALTGAAAGSVEANQKREALVRNCMKGRGHAVVG